MNILLFPETKMLATTEGAGGLFDFNATLPLMAIQFILLTVALTFLFYKPVSKVIDEREAYIGGNLTTASEKLIKADELYNEYDEQLKTARANAKAVIATAEKEAKDVVASEVSKARQEAPKIIAEAEDLVRSKKNAALVGIDAEVDQICQTLQVNLFGQEVNF